MRERTEENMRGRHKIPVPEDFTATARECGNMELSKLYGVSESTITDWRKPLRVPAPRQRRKTGARIRLNVDTPEQIAMCLHCKLNYCDGLCLRMKLAKRGALVCYT